MYSSFVFSHLLQEVRVFYIYPDLLSGIKPSLSTVFIDQALKTGYSPVLTEVAHINAPLSYSPTLIDITQPLTNRIATHSLSNITFASPPFCSNRFPFINCPSIDGLYSPLRPSEDRVLKLSKFLHTK